MNMGNIDRAGFQNVRPGGGPAATGQPGMARPGAARPGSGTASPFGGSGNGRDSFASSPFASLGNSNPDDMNFNIPGQDLARLERQQGEDGRRSKPEWR